MKKIFFALLLAVVLTLLVMPVMVNAGTNVEYLYPVYNTDGDPTSGIKEWKKGTKECEAFPTSENISGSGEIWLYVDGEVNVNPSSYSSYSDFKISKKSVHLVLKDGAKLTITGGIYVYNSGSLTIYAQSTGEYMGKFETTGNNKKGGISTSYSGTESITINGGNIKAEGDLAAAGIGYVGSENSNNCQIVINGGKVYAKGGNAGYSYGGGAGIGGGGIHNYGSSLPASGNIIINGGSVTAIGGDAYGDYGAGAGIGSGGSYVGQTPCKCDGITINGGTVFAQGGKNNQDSKNYNYINNGAAIGEGSYTNLYGGDPTTLNISMYICQ